MNGIETCMTHTPEHGINSVSTDVTFASGYDAGMVEVRLEEHVAVVTLNRQAKRNALTLEMIERFRAITEEVDRDDAVRVIVITGAGERAFCAGGDLNSLLPAALAAKCDVVNPDPTQRFLSGVFTPVIAAVEGACLGAGLEIMLGSDLRVAASNAVFGLPEPTRGLISGANVRLPRQLPWPIAMHMLLIGGTMTAARAFEVGLVNEVVPPGRALGRALELAARLCENAPIAVRTAKEIAVRTAALADGFVLEHALNDRVLSSCDAREGIESFHEKRRPFFSGS